MLDEYFEEQMKEIIRMCAYQTDHALLCHHERGIQTQPTWRRVSLKQPVRNLCEKQHRRGALQEFVRIRPAKKGDKEAVVGALLTQTFQDHVMVFTQTKKQAQRMHILLGLMGLKVGKLHGNLSQTQRLESLR
ncbi:probable ATP-dependent RNA helicase DDX27 [Salvelinus sp. IW2-2015]|uniref:probable ATP-dependent RNA helicase DDX27 n=1 Tax=Salvelinus sp. IW2-2015 TaxID=2691554 RepID=UPI000CDFAE4B|nr:probable ATP-dependent RNA helicase DDX27 [Salvelinus alpinus]